MLEPRLRDSWLRPRGSVFAHVKERQYRTWSSSSLYWSRVILERRRGVAAFFHKPWLAGALGIL